jgi:signal transduction histidine kinase
VVVRVIPAVSAIEVCDEGSGIDQTQREQIFEPFWKKPSSEGRGLGLTIVREMAQLHGAQVNVRSNEPRGSIFRIDFPKPKPRSALQRTETSSKIKSPETVGLADTNPLPS